MRRETEDLAMVQKLERDAARAATKSPELVTIQQENGCTVVRIKNNNDGRLREAKLHKPGTCLEPGR